MIALPALALVFLALVALYAAKHNQAHTPMVNGFLVAALFLCASMALNGLALLVGASQVSAPGLRRPEDLANATLMFGLAPLSFAIGCFIGFLAVLNLARRWSRSTER